MPPTRGELLKAFAAQQASRNDLSALAAALTQQQQNYRSLPGVPQWPNGQQVRQLPRPVSDFSGDAFGPFQPATLNPIDAPTRLPGGPMPRSLQYPVGWNLPTGPRALEAVPFQVLQNVADYVDVVRKAIEIHKNEVGALEWDVVIENPALAKAKGKDYLLDERTAIVTWLNVPDRKRDYLMSDWLRLVVDEALSKDALTIYPVPTLGRNAGPLGSQLHSLRIIDGSTIKPLIDTTGDTPEPPEPAYQQFLYGVPRSEFAAVDEDQPLGAWTTEQLIYRPRYRRAGALYGFPPTEQVLMTALTYINRQKWWSSYFTDSDLPAGFIMGADGWTPDELERWEQALYALMGGDPGWKWRIKAAPYGSSFTPLKQPTFDTTFDEFLIKIVAMVFDLTPAELGFGPKSGLGGKGFGEEQADLQQRKGVRPLLKWLEELLTKIIRVYFQQPLLCFKFVGLEIEDEKTRSAIDKEQWSIGALTINEIREGRGDDRFNEPNADAPMIMTTTGPVLLSQVGAAPALTTAGGSVMGPDGKPLGNAGNSSGPDESGAPTVATPAKPKPAGSSGAAGTKAAATELGQFERYLKNRRPFEFAAVEPWLAARLNKAVLGQDAAALEAARKHAQVRQRQRELRDALAANAGRLLDTEDGYGSSEFVDDGADAIEDAAGAGWALGAGTGTGQGGSGRTAGDVGGAGDGAGASPHAGRAGGRGGAPAFPDGGGVGAADQRSGGLRGLLDAGADWAARHADQQREYLGGWAGELTQALVEAGAAADDALLPTADVLASRADLYTGGVWEGYERGNVAAAVDAASAETEDNPNPPTADEVASTMQIRWNAEADCCPLCGERNGQTYTPETLPCYPSQGGFGEYCSGGVLCRCFLAVIEDAGEQ